MNVTKEQAFRFLLITLCSENSKLFISITESGNTFSIESDSRMCNDM